MHIYISLSLSFTISLSFILFVYRWRTPAVSSTTTPGASASRWDFKKVPFNYQSFHLARLAAHDAAPGVPSFAIHSVCVHVGMAVIWCRHVHRSMHTHSNEAFCFKHTQRVCKDGRRLPYAQTCSNGVARSHGSGLHCDSNMRYTPIYIYSLAAGIWAQESGNIRPDSWQARAMLEEARHEYHVCMNRI